MKKSQRNRNGLRDEEGRRERPPKHFLKYMKKKLALTFLLVALVLLGLAVWYLFGMYGPGFVPADFIYYNF